MTFYQFKTAKRFLRRTRINLRILFVGLKKSKLFLLYKEALSENVPDSKKVKWTFHWGVVVGKPKVQLSSWVQGRKTFSLDFHIRFENRKDLRKICSIGWFCETLKISQDGLESSSKYAEHLLNLYFSLYKLL